MFPLSDDNSEIRITPWVNYSIVAINVIVFVLFQQAGANDQFTNAFSVVPAEIVSGHDVQGQVQITNALTGAREPALTLYPCPFPVYVTLITSMFMHGGWAHIGGNMLYLWIFGDNLENLMGHLKYFFFYMICGIVAGLSHVFCTAVFNQNMLIPSLGASGAISGVLGGYILLFPNKRVTVIFLQRLMQVPAYLCLGIWIVFQLVDSAGMLGGDAQDTSGVAYAAHIGGFIIGAALVKLFISEES